MIGTAAANAVMTALQWRRLRIGFNGRLEGPQTVMITVRILVASAIMAVIARLIWEVLRSLLGESLPGGADLGRGCGRGLAGALREAGAGDADPRGPADPGPLVGRCARGRDRR